MSLVKRRKPKREKYNDAFFTLADIEQLVEKLRNQLSDLRDDDTVIHRKEKENEHGPRSSDQ